MCVTQTILFLFNFLIVSVCLVFNAFFGHVICLIRSSSVGLTLFGLRNFKHQLCWKAYIHSSYVLSLLIIKHRITH